MKRFLSMLAMVVGASAGGGAHAAVRYQFQAFSTISSNGSPNFSGSFDVTLPTYLESTSNFSYPEFIDKTGFTTCKVNNPGYVCGDSYFYAAEFPGYDAFSFRIMGYGQLYGPMFYFADGAFGKSGTYDSLLLGSSQAGRLIVSSTSSTPVPEPASWALMIGGFAAVGGSLRRRQVRRSLA